MKKETLQRSPGTSLLYILIPVVVIIWFGINWYIAKKFPEPETAGDFGEQFGAVEALFSGLAFALFFYTMWLQRIDLVNQQEILLAQKEELRLTREVHAAQAEEFRISNETARMAKFENTYFGQLRDFRELIRYLKFCKYEGVDVFDVIFKLFVQYWNTNSYEGELGKKEFIDRNIDCGTITYGIRIDAEYLNAENPREVLRKKYDEFSLVHRDIISHYFRALYCMFLVVEEAGLPAESKQFYLRLLRAQLTNNELILIFLNGISSVGQDTSTFIEKYSLFKHLDKDFKKYWRAEEIYPASAFEGEIEKSQ